MTQQYPFQPPQPPQPTQQQPTQPPMPPAQHRAKRRSWPIVLTVVLCTLGLFGGCSALVATAGGGSTPTSVAASPSESTASDQPSDEPTDEPTQQEQTKQPRPEPTAFRTLTARRWKVIARNPDAHIGETYIVYGEVTQADAATGDDTIRADVGGVRSSCSYGFCDYPTNTILTGPVRKMGKVVEGDTFRAKVTVLGSLDYDTTLGGSTTVPALQVAHIIRTGSAS